MTISDNTTGTTANRVLLGPNTFQFACHKDVPCFTRCCHNADMYLYPYDVVRMKQNLNMTSEEFLVAHTTTAIRDMPTFPNVMLKMSDRNGNPCTFLTEKGCTIYPDRPYSCRAYPLEPAIYGDADGSMHVQYYVMHHDYCKGHDEDKTWTAKAWMADQEMDPYLEPNNGWARIAGRLQADSFRSRDIDVNSPPMKMAFMAAYNMDTFRRFVFESSFLSRYNVPDRQLDAVKHDDRELLMLGLSWIERILFGDGPLEEIS
ncbi:YkgJ family cysteine cluster protein [uncultured Desulfobacter sp.]|uniref:YkgJ family cysteine cluster protein n=1 Tax=uncultured Desulfobacter sp. TaxID=240139 RepID=UPI002AAB3B81|nr:YkgJ family cysteine cluster protein [uncultured Desulfobacter sp.]